MASWEKGHELAERCGKEWGWRHYLLHLVCCCCCCWSGQIWGWSFRLSANLKENSYFNKIRYTLYSLKKYRLYDFRFVYKYKCKYEKLSRNCSAMIILEHISALPFFRFILCLDILLFHEPISFWNVSLFYSIIKVA